MRYSPYPLHTLHTLQLTLSLLCTLALAVLALPVHAQAFYAGQLTPENLHRLPAGGLDAVGGTGDWFLTDGELCAVVSGAGHPTYLALHGGALVDLWHCAQANDQWSVAHTQLNMQKDQIPPTREIRAGSDSGAAWVETLGVRAGLEARVRFSLSSEHPGELGVETTVTRRADGEAMGMFGALVLHPDAALTPFTVDTLDGEYTLGFDQPSIDTTDTGSVLAAVTGANLQVLLGSRHLQPTISYGVRMREALLRDADGGERPVHHFLISGRTFSLFGAFTRPFPGFWPRKPGLVSFALGQVFDLREGESLVFRQAIAASDRGDAAVFLDAVYTGAEVRGRVDTARAGITVRDASGRPLTFVRPDARGHFSFRLPAGVSDATAVLRTPWGETGHSFTVAQGPVDLGTLDSGASGALALPRGDAMSLVFLRDNRPQLFHGELAGASVDGERQLAGRESYRLSLAGVPSDPAQVVLPPGRYRVLASRGPEFEVTEASVDLAADEQGTLDIAIPRRVLATPGLLGADFHVHSGVSFDSSLPPTQRVRDFVAQGGELLVPTEHSISYDLADTIASLGLQDRVATFPGVELTGMARSAAAPTTIGHSNVFPVAADPGAFMGGTLPFEGRRLGQVIGAYKAAYPDSVFQLNHPRGEAHDDDISFFNHLSIGRAFEPGRPLSEAPNNVLLERHADSAYRDLDFDAMELLNGASMTLYRAVRADWFALLRQNHYKVATANSDSHASSQLVAYPRNYLVLDDDDPAALSPAAAVGALLAGRLYGSTGPQLRVAVDGSGPGATHPRAQGTLAVAVDAAPWVGVQEVHVWLNGELWRTLPAAPGDRLEIPLDVDADSFVFVEVQGTPTPIYEILAPGFTPFAFANPVFIDVDGDGWRYNTPAP